MFRVAYISVGKKWFWEILKQAGLFQSTLWKKQHQWSQPIERESQHAICTFFNLTSRPNRNSPRLLQQLCGFRLLLPRPAGFSRTLVSVPTLSVCLSCLSICLSDHLCCLSIYMYMYTYICIYVSLHQSFFLSLNLQFLSLSSFLYSPFILLPYRNLKVSVWMQHLRATPPLFGWTVQQNWNRRNLHELSWVPFIVFFI
jgi:hypothetical protein